MGQDHVPENPANEEHSAAPIDLTVDVASEPDRLVLRNRSGRRVACVVLDADLMMIAQFPPGGAAVITLESGAEATVPFADIRGHTADSRAATLHWWPLRTHGDSLDADDYVRTSDVRLRW